jgi:hypothetical protein
MMPLTSEQAANIDRFFTAVKSLNQLDLMEIRNVVSGVLSPTVRESYFTLNYHRAAINIELVLTLKDLKQFQAITMLTRAILETAVEIKLIRLHPDAATKISLFSQVQKLKSAKKIAKFKEDHPDAKVGVGSYEQFITLSEARILHEKQQMWPGAKKIDHWSMMNMEVRCRHLGREFDELYQNHYAQLSWYVHSGVTGIANMTGEALSNLCGMAFRIIMECYASILEEVVNEFKIYNADDKLKKRITYAKMLPFTNSQEQIDGLAVALGV